MNAAAATRWTELRYKCQCMKPKTSEHDGVLVVRDDLFPGGTKARFLGRLYDDADEVVYASPAEGGAQTALAQVAQALGKKATILVAARQAPHPRTLMAKRLGAQVLQVHPGYLAVVQKRARDYCAEYGAKLMPFGADMPEAIDAIAKAAASLKLKPDEVWCAAGSGVLARGLAKAWPDAERHVVMVGRQISADDVAGAAVHPARAPFATPERDRPPFPSDPHYDAKAWWECVGCRRARWQTKRVVVFWNVTGPAEP